MALQWKQFPANVPADGQIIWVRVYWYYGTAFKAEYDATTKMVVSVDGGFEYPVWGVSRWAAAD